MHVIMQQRTTCSVTKCFLWKVAIITVSILKHFWVISHFYCFLQNSMCVYTSFWCLQWENAMSTVKRIKCPSRTKTASLSIIDKNYCFQLARLFENAEAQRTLFDTPLSNRLWLAPTLARICPEVDTLRINLCEVSSCSPSLSEDSSPASPACKGGKEFYPDHWSTEVLCSIIRRSTILEQDQETHVAALKWDWGWE